MGSQTVRIPRKLPRAGGHSVAVVPCGEDRGCYRWTILSGDGTCAERSSYSYATVAGARAVGEIRLREQRLGALTADLLPCRTSPVPSPASRILGGTGGFTRVGRG